jgi:hypothetical protein
MNPVVSRRRAAALSLCLIVLAANPLPILARAGPGPSSEASLEYQVKAAFILNFARFVEWPAGATKDPNAPLEILVLGSAPIEEALLRTVRGQTVMGRPLSVRAIDGADQVPECHVLFISRSEERRLDAILKQVRSRCVLTVGEVEGFAEAGGVINFTTEENKVRFEINPDAAEGAGLKISSKLLSLARIVKGSPRGGKD